MHKVFKMRGQDLINRMLPDETLMEIMKFLDGRSGDRDACALVCKRWQRCESASRLALTIGATGQPDTCLAKNIQRFTNLRQICVDERLPVPLHHHRRLPLRHALVARMTRPLVSSYFTSSDPSSMICRS